MCKDLATKESFPVPNTFGRARLLVKAAGKDVDICFLKGFLEDKMTFFPAVKFRDIRGKRKVWWNRRDFVHRHQGEKQPSPLSQVADMTLRVSSKIQRCGITYSRDLEKYRDNGMP